MFDLIIGLIEGVFNLVINFIYLILVSLNHIEAIFRIRFKYKADDWP